LIQKNQLQLRITNYYLLPLHVIKKVKMTLHQTLTVHIQKAVLELFNIAIEKVEFQATRKDFEGDVTMVVFPLVKVLIGNPVEIT
jgi:hypothetical protein